MAKKQRLLKKPGKRLLTKKPTNGSAALEKAAPAKKKAAPAKKKAAPAKKKAAPKKLPTKKAPPQKAKPAKKLLPKKPAPKKAPPQKAKPAKKLLPKKPALEKAPLQKAKPAKKLPPKKPALEKAPPQKAKPAKKPIQQISAPAPARPAIVGPDLSRRKKKTLPEPKRKTAEERRFEAAQKQAARLALAAQREEARLARAAREEAEKVRRAAEKQAERTAREAREAEERAARTEQKAAAQVLAAEERERARQEARRIAEHKQQLALIARAVAQAEREADRIAAAQAAAEAKKRQAERRAAEKLEQQEAKGAARQAQAAGKERLRQLTRSLDAHDKAERARLGATAAELLEGFLSVLAQRPDLAVSHTTLGPPAGGDELLDFAERAPLEALSFARALGPLEFRWHFRSHPELGGQLEIAGLQARADHLVERMQACFAAPELEAGVRKRLALSSLPRFSSRAELLDALRERGLTGQRAEALLDTLGEASAWLFEGSASAEGRRRQALLSRARELSSAEPTLPLRAVVRELNQGPPLDKATWQRVVKAHLAFLEAGGGGGDFTLTVEGGLPRLTYEKPAAGQAQLSFENLTGLKGSGLRLAHADFCGARADAVSFSRSDLEGSFFAFAELAEASFADCRLRGTDFRSARLTGADFRRTDLTDVNFEGADLRGANFAGATTSGTRFGGANVQGIKY